MTVRMKATLVLGSLVFANLAIWGLKQFEAHLWLHDVVRGLAQFGSN